MSLMDAPARSITEANFGYSSSALNSALPRRTRASIKRDPVGLAVPTSQAQHPRVPLEDPAIDTAYDRIAVGTDGPRDHQRLSNVYTAFALVARGCGGALTIFASRLCSLLGHPPRSPLLPTLSR